MKKPRKKIAHAFNGEHKHGAHCRERVPFRLGDLTIMVACGWPRSVHPRSKP